MVSSAIVVALAIASTLQFRGGADAVPDPIVELLRALFDYRPDLSARLIAAATGAAAAAVLLFSVIGANRFLPISFCAIGAFVALSCVSRALSAGGLGFPLISLVVSATLLLAMLRTVPAEPSERRGLSAGWTALGVIAVATATGAVAGPASDPNRPTEATEAAKAAEQASKVINVDLDMHPYVGRRIEETPLADYLPSLPSRARDRVTLVVLYMPGCSACHSLFTEFFSTPRLEQVFTVEIPPAEGIPDFSSPEDHGPIDCVGCEPMLLAPGPNYLVASPMVVKIENNLVTCVSDRFKGECLLAK